MTATITITSPTTVLAEGTSVRNNQAKLVRITPRVLAGFDR